MKFSKRRRRFQPPRRGAAVVEFAVCVPVLVLIGFGFIYCGLLVQMRHNSKLIGHMVATEVFKLNQRDSIAFQNLEDRFEQIADDLGIVGLQVSINETDNIAVVTTSLSISDNSPLNLSFQASDILATQTHVYAPVQ